MKCVPPQRLTTHGKSKLIMFNRETTANLNSESVLQNPKTMLARINQIQMKQGKIIDIATHLVDPEHNFHSMSPQN